MNRALAGIGLSIAFGLVLMTPGLGGQELPAVDDLLVRVGERVSALYDRAQRVMCLETSSVQPIDRSYALDGFARTVESELRIEQDSSGEPTVVREVRKVNGRVPRDKDRLDRAGCTDPNPLSSEPLAFLLPAHRSEYEFRVAKLGTDRGRSVVLVDFATVNRASELELVEDAAGHDDCFDWSGHVARTGRIWVDEETGDVVRVDRRLRSLVDVRVPPRIQQSHRLDSYLVIEREDTSIRYSPVVFSDPDERLLLPESIHSVTIVRSGLQSTRRSQTYSNYRRFVTAGRIVQ